MRILSRLVHMLFTSVKHSRQVTQLNSTKEDEHDMCGVRILQQDAQHPFGRNHIWFSLFLFAQPFGNNGELHEGREDDLLDGAISGVSVVLRVKQGGHLGELRLVGGRGIAVILEGCR